LDNEVQASSQVPLLLTMQENEKALEKAVKSGDTDLGVYSNKRKIFKMIISNAPH